MGNFSPFSFSRLGRDALDHLYPSAAYVADFGRGLYRTPNTRRASLADAITCNRETVTTAVKNGKFTSITLNKPMLTDIPSLRIEPQATNLLAWADIATGFGQSGGWAMEGGATQTSAELSGGVEGLRIGSDGTDDARVRVNAALSVSAGQAYAASFYYIAGTSDRVRVQVGSGTVSLIAAGPVGAVQSAFSRDVTEVAIVNRNHGGGVWSAEIKFRATVAATLEVAIGPSSETLGEDVIALAAQVEEGTAATSLILSEGATTTRAADVVSAPAPAQSGAFHVTITFMVAAAQPADSYNRVLEVYGPDHRGFLQVEGSTGQLRMLTQDGLATFQGVSLGSATPGSWQTVIMAFDGANSKGLLTGGSIVMLNGAALSELTTLSLGSARGAASQMAAPLFIANINAGTGSITDDEMHSQVGSLL